MEKGFVLQDPGYEYPPEPELRFKYYKLGRDVDEDEDDDDDDENDETRDNNNNNSRSSNDTNRNLNAAKNDRQNATSAFTRNGQTKKSKNGCVAADEMIKLSTSTSNTASNNNLNSK